MGGRNLMSNIFQFTTATYFQIPENVIEGHDADG
jgi:hypothetical protein